MLINKQPIEKAVKGDGNMLDFHSMFFTIQGEGPFAGDRAVFIRLAGCNLQCPGCDTEYTEGRQMLSAATIAGGAIGLLDSHEIERCLVVITGGEPLRQNIARLVFELLQTGRVTVQIECNGVLPPSPELELYLKREDVHLVVSPKTSRINNITAGLASAFKYVLRAGEIDPDDGLPTRALVHKATPRVARPPAEYRGPVYVNPMDEHNDACNQMNLTECARAAQEHGHRMGIQLHKLLNLE